ncbi:hypothetical protein DICPUDRAFT_80806 [Dictyostelium purpureum]|uniref:Methyltransferase small domain-containing protein n=1 Tax=Dictyostelium purpureum TaxID=5786 RepID=F0ZRL0_DICPU|nr:uncharacterized protein DICPUDRAFT_80806 [Dictyostelium purpureum]EGC33437.1 hypothetical protein DICPUDRAFT_80806 [Dictyostelium purpureum]|eukprot:XP_003290056.1 hypothetical protein DICPUDRAFT_80806 [Dictyostelium purpureum]
MEEFILTNDITENNKWQEEQKSLFLSMYGIKENESIDMDGKILRLHPNVFSPKHFPESRWYASTLANKIVKKGESFLEIGAGSGISSLYVSEIGANVTSVDINPDAVEITKLNFKLNKLESNVFQSDIYNSLPNGSKYKYIFWNHPWQVSNESVIQELRSEKTLDQGYILLTRYISESKKYLTDDGFLLLGTCNFAKIEQIIQIADRLGYKIVIMEKGSASLNQIAGVNETYFILKFVPL